MANHDGKCRASHEAHDSGDWDELENETKTEETDTSGGTTANECKGCSNYWTFISIFWVLISDFSDCATDLKGHDSYRTDTDIFEVAKKQ